jgi:predicted transcriptional regulator
MITYKWSILEIFGDQNIEKVRYSLKAQDESNIVETEGEHSFLKGTVTKSLSEIKEDDLSRWIEQDTTKDDVNIIKLNLEKQLEALKTSKKIVFPWETETFTIG